MKLFEQYNIDIGYVVMGMAGVILIMLILLIVTMAKNASMRKKYKIFIDRKSTRLNSSHVSESRMPSSA